MNFCAFGLFSVFDKRYIRTGIQNILPDSYALYHNSTGDDNTANGYATLFANTTGSYNTAYGNYALYHNTTGDNNTAHGGYALTINTTGSNNIALGYGAGSAITGSNNIAIGNPGTGHDAAIIRIGERGIQRAAFIAGISGVTAIGGVAVYINGNGQFGTLTSSRRFKKDIKDIGHVSDKLMKLRPVTFRYKASAEDGSHPLQYGLIAEEVAKVYPELVQYDKQGKPFTIYYHLLTPMLLSELQKEHRRNDAQRQEINALKAELTGLKQSQQQVLAKMAAFIQATQHRESVQKAAFVHQQPGSPRANVADVAHR